jgi:hypothetical protein
MFNKSNDSAREFDHSNETNGEPYRDAYITDWYTSRPEKDHVSKAVPMRMPRPVAPVSITLVSLYSHHPCRRNYSLVGIS